MQGCCIVTPSQRRVGNAGLRGQGGILRALF
jgi:hypothetical protein